MRISKLRRPAPGTVLGGAALVVAMSGVAVAGIPGSGDVVTACLGNGGQLRVIDAEAGERCGGSQTPLRLAAVDATGSVAAAQRADRAGDAQTLDGKDSTDFLAAGGKAADADALDGRDSADFLAAGAKAADADAVDGIDGADLLRRTSVGPQAVALDLAGTVRVRSLLRNGAEAHAPHPAGGVVVRAVQHGLIGAGQLVARAGTLRLERDGTIGGLRVRWPANPGQAVIACEGTKADGSRTSTFRFFTNAEPAGSVTVAQDAADVGLLTCTFGRPHGVVDGGVLGMPDVTRITLVREVVSGGFSAAAWVRLPRVDRQPVSPCVVAGASAEAPADAALTRS